MRPLLYHLSYTADRKESTRCATGFYPNPGHCARDCEGISLAEGRKPLQLHVECFHL
jgi:hypothetical protein